MSPAFRELVPYFINFGLVLVLLVFMGRKPLRKFIYQRHERMRDAIEAAGRAHKQAMARAEAARAALQGLPAEESGLLQKEAAGAEAEGKEILSKGQGEAKRILAEADRLASVEQDEASDRVKESFVNLIVGATEESLKRGLKKDDHSAILKRAQDSIEVGV